MERKLMTYRSNVFSIRDFTCQSSKRRTEVQKFLTTEEVADLFRQKPRTITAWANAYVDSGGAEGIPAHRKGRRWLFVEAEIMRSVENAESTEIRAIKLRHG
jgi:hypothetical protein